MRWSHCTVAAKENCFQEPFKTTKTPIQFLTLALYKFIYLLTYCPASSRLSGRRIVDWNARLPYVHCWVDMVFCGTLPITCSNTIPVGLSFIHNAQCHRQTGGQTDGRTGDSIMPIADLCWASSRDRPKMWQHVYCV